MLIMNNEINEVLRNYLFVYVIKIHFLFGFSASINFSLQNYIKMHKRWYYTTNLCIIYVNNELLYYAF